MRVLVEPLRVSCEGRLSARDSLLRSSRNALGLRSARWSRGSDLHLAETASERRVSVRSSDASVLSFDVSVRSFDVSARYFEGPARDFEVPGRDFDVSARNCRVSARDFEVSALYSEESERYASGAARASLVSEHSISVTVRELRETARDFRLAARSILLTAPDSRLTTSIFECSGCSARLAGDESRHSPCSTLLLVYRSRRPEPITACLAHSTCRIGSAG